MPNRSAFRIAAGAAALAIALALPASAEIQPFPASFQARTIQSGDAALHVMVGGRGPAVVLLHGFGDSGAMWSPLAARLAAKHTVVVPDLRGMGLSSHPPAATTSGPRPATSAPSSTGSASTAPPWSATTSARWWRSPTRRATPTGPSAWW